MTEKRHRTHSLFTTCLVLALGLPAMQTLGAGFQLLEQSVRGIGYASSGASVGYGDGSSVFFNPAAMSRLDGAVLTLGGHEIMPSARFSNTGSSIPATGEPVRGGNGGDGAESAFVPNLYYAAPLRGHEQLTLGLAINSPFGLMTDYPDNWVGRYQAIRSRLTTVNFNPGLGYRLTDRIAVGAGVSAVYLDAELSQAIDFGTIAGVGPQLLDGKTTVEGDDWGYGWNAGVLLRLAEESLVGLAYRSKVDATLDGDVSFTVPAPLRGIQAGGLFVDGGGQADLTLPETVSLGASHRVTDKAVLLGEVAWTRWSRFDQLLVVYDNPVQPPAGVDENWDDTFRLSGGIDYALGEQWTLRGGLTYDQSPVPDARYRTPRIPDMDRYWLAFGLGFDATENLAVDLGYVHIFVEDGESELLSPTGSTLVGEWESQVDILSLSVTWAL